MSLPLLAALKGDTTQNAEAIADKTAAIREEVAAATALSPAVVAAFEEETLQAAGELVVFARAAGATTNVPSSDDAVAAVRAMAMAAAGVDATAKEELAELSLDDFVTAIVEPQVWSAMKALKALEAAEAALAAAETDEDKAAKQQEVDACVERYVASLDAAEEAEKKADDEAAKAASELAAQQDALAKAKAPADTAQTESADSVTVRSTAAEPYATLLEKRADANARVQLLLSVLGDVVDNGAKVTEFVTKVSNAWDEEMKALDELVDDCDARAQALVGQPPRLLPDDALAVAPVKADLAKLKELRGGVEAAVSKDAEARATFDEKLVEFNRERERALLWTRQQKANLDGTSDVDAVQEFCASLLDHTPAMEANIGVLLEMAEPLLPSPVVQAALLEVNEVWLNLHITAYERLRKTLLEVHERAKLEDEVRAYAGYTTNALDYVKSVLKLLGDPTTAESAALVADLVSEGRDLAAELERNHCGLAAQLRDFALRMEGFRDNYANLRRAVFARLTFLASNVPTLTTSVRRKEEYRDRMQALQRWVQAKSRGESWGDIQSRVSKLRQMVADETAAMAAEPPLSTETQEAAKTPQQTA